MICLSDTIYFHAKKKQTITMNLLSLSQLDVISEVCISVCLTPLLFSAINAFGFFFPNKISLLEVCNFLVGSIGLKKLMPFVNGIAAVL